MELRRVIRRPGAAVTRGGWKRLLIAGPSVGKTAPSGMHAERAGAPDQDANGTGSGRSVGRATGSGVGPAPAGAAAAPPSSTPPPRPDPASGTVGTVAGSRCVVGHGVRGTSSTPALPPVRQHAKRSRTMRVVPAHDPAEGSR